MRESEMMKAYLSYPLNTPNENEIRSLLLDEVIEYAPKITLKGEVHDANKQVPRDLLDFLVNERGAEVEQIAKTMYRGKKNVFGIPFTKSQTISIDGVKYAQVRVLGDDIFMLTEGLVAVRENTASVKIDEGMCVWDQSIALDMSELEDSEYWVDTSSESVKARMKEWSKEEQANKQLIEEIEPTVKPEFNKKEMQAQKELELVTYRGEM